ncbi:MAG TPA: DUF2269 family protein [Nocardioidaceae bacterium]|nr:DUF2269 family protein [Nocardioidaceae bacterium]
METVLNVLHVVTAVFIIGPMAVLPMIAMHALRARQPASVASLARLTTITSWGSLIVAILGFGVLGMSDPQYDLSITTPWVWTSLILYLAALALSLLGVAPATRHAGERLQTLSGDAEQAPRHYARIAASSGTVSVLLLVVVVLMVWKP